MASREGIPPLSFPSFRFQVARIRYFVVTRVIAFSRALLGWTPREWFDATFLENGLSIDYNGGSFLPKILKTRRSTNVIERFGLREEKDFSPREYLDGEKFLGNKFLCITVSVHNRFILHYRKKIQESDEISRRGNREAPDGTGTIEFINYEYLSSWS